MYGAVPALAGLTLLPRRAGTSTRPCTSAPPHCLAAHPAVFPCLSPRRAAVQIGEELRAGRTEAAHLPGFRYLYQDAGQQVARSSPRAKVSAMSHHARTLAAAVRHSLGQMPGASAGCAEAAGAGANAGGQELEAAAPTGGSSLPGDHEVLELLARSCQECWVAAWRPGDGRQLLAVRERRAEREPAQAAEVMQAFAATNFYM